MEGIAQNYFPQTKHWSLSSTKATTMPSFKFGKVWGLEQRSAKANPVLIKKNNGDWRICTDFTDLNKAYSKNRFLLPRIDQMVDVTAGYELLNFMDAYSGYNQIHRYELDQEHTSYIINRGSTIIGWCLLDWRIPKPLINALWTPCSPNKSKKPWKCT